MRLNVAFAALLTSTALWETALGEELDELDVEYPSSSSAATTTTSTVSRPKFTQLPIQAPFFEQFTDDWKKRWKVSKAKKVNDRTSNEEWAYVGQWAVEEPTVLKGIDGDKGLVVKNVAAHHAISTKFDKPLDNSGKTLVVQYEVKLQNGLECGGAYLKLLKEEAALHAEEFSNASPYVIMFGPDKCGPTNKVHFIFNHKNHITGKYEEKHLTTPPMIRNTKKSTLYTLIVKPDQTFEIRMDGKNVSQGSLLEKFTPAVNPPEEIEDPEDKKPTDWVEESEIPDPDAKKPDDWDEDAPYEIVDENAKKPDDWLEDEPEFVPDPDAKKPEDWDDEEDGTWLPPTIPNPKCAQASGCGKWQKPMIVNPSYKGKWKPPMISNPAWKGIWTPRKIKNPDYYHDATPSNFEPMGGIGFELWTMQNGILFDNIYVGHSIQDAEKIRKQTFDVKRKVEDEEDEKANPKPDDKEPPVIDFKSDPVGYVKSKLELFLSLVQKDPVGAIKAVPEAAGGIIAVFVTLFAILASLIGMASTPAKVPKPKPTPKKEEAKPVAAAAKEASSSSDEGKPKARRTTKRAD